MSELIHVINNELQSVAPSSIKDFCMAAPRGAYTTLQITRDYFAVDFDVHIERLIKSIAAVHAKLNNCYAHYYTALKNQVSKTRLLLGGVDLPFESDNIINLLLILPCSLQDLQAASPRSEPAALQAAVLPSLRLALTTAETRYAQGTSKIATIIVSPTDDLASPEAASLGSCLTIHVAVALDPRLLEQQANNDTSDDSNNNNTFAVILGPPREISIGKDSGWVAQRQSLEALRPSGAAEILLTTRQGDLLEGLVTNVYIITAVPEGKVVLQTAGMGDGVVWGTMRKRVLQACKQLGLRVVEQPPAAAERGQWKEGFLTNALRGVQPLHRIECDARNVWGLEPWRAVFSEVPGFWTTKIQALVESSLQHTDLRKLPPLPL
jgi:Amino-transferase class IV